MSHLNVAFNRLLARRLRERPDIAFYTRSWQTIFYDSQHVPNLTPRSGIGAKFETATAQDTQICVHVIFRSDDSRVLDHLNLTIWPSIPKSGGRMELSNLTFRVISKEHYSGIHLMKTTCKSDGWAQGYWRFIKMCSALWANWLQRFEQLTFTKMTCKLKYCTPVRYLWPVAPPSTYQNMINLTSSRRLSEINRWHFKFQLRENYFLGHFHHVLMINLR